MTNYPKVHENHPSGLPEHPYGNIFYVNSHEGTNSIAGGRGTRPEKPFETITYAIAQCVSGHGDTIFVTTHQQWEAHPIVVNKQNLQIFGLPNNTPGRANQALTWLVPDGHATGGVFTISVGSVLIQDFMLHSTAGQPCIDFAENATSTGITIKGCSFHVGSYGILTGNAGAFRQNSPAHYLAIVGCHFGPSLTVGGIYFRSNGSWPIITDCYFNSTPMPNIDIHLNDECHMGRILNNLFMLPAEGTIGGAIDIATGHTRWIIDGNRANDAADVGMGSNPYQDVDSTNAWFRNYMAANADPTDPA